MRSVDLDVTGAGDVVRQKTAISGRSGGVVRAGEDQGWNAEVGDFGAGIEVAHRAATSDVALRIESLDDAKGGGDANAKPAGATTAAEPKTEATKPAETATTEVAPSEKKATESTSAPEKELLGNDSAKPAANAKP